MAKPHTVIHVTDLRRRAGQVLDVVAAGETVVIRRRGRETAVLIPWREFETARLTAEDINELFPDMRSADEL